MCTNDRVKEMQRKWDKPQSQVMDMQNVGREFYLSQATS